MPEPQTLTWDSLIRQTLSLNPDLQAARYVVTSTARSRDIAFGDYLPSFEGDLQRSVSRNGFSGGGNNASSGSGGGGNALRDNLSLDLVGNQSLFNGFGTTGSFIKARKDLDAAKFQYVVTSANVRNALKLAYIDVLLSVSAVDPEQIALKQQSEEVRTDAEVIEAIKNCIKMGINTKMKIVKSIKTKLSISNRSALNVLEKYSGIDPVKHIWNFQVVNHGAQAFYLLDTPILRETEKLES